MAKLRKPPAPTARRTPSRWIFRVGIVLVAGLAMALWAANRRPQVPLIVDNRSGQPLASLKVTTSAGTNTYSDIATGTTVTVPLGTGERFFTLDVKFPDGTRNHFQGPAKERARLIVLPDRSFKFQTGDRAG